MSQDTLNVNDVFPLSGVPSVTFVEPVHYSRLKSALLAPGRGILIEGPSGIGKTTAVLRAIDELGLSSEVLELSARKPGDVITIRSIPDGTGLGFVLIDDFHRLDPEDLELIADHLKILADEGRSDTKLIILGINKTGESLISYGRDTAARLEVIRFQREPDHHLNQVITQGQRELNVKIGNAEEIVKAANGSFNLVQLMCHETCLAADIIYRTGGSPRDLNQSFELVNGRILDRFAAEFHRPVLNFVRGNKLRREGRAPYLHLLKWLGESDSWTIDVEREMQVHTNLRGSINQVIKKGYLEEHIAKDSTGVSDLIHYDTQTRTLAIEDPKFYYYIRNISWNKLASEVGFIDLNFGHSKDFALSFAGKDRPLAEAIFEALSEAELEVFYDKNEQHRILAENVEEYLDPIYRSEAAFVICLLGPEYPQRIWAKFESEAFRSRFGSNDVVPIWFANAMPGMFDESREYGGITYDPERDLNQQAQDISGLLVEKLSERRMQAAETAKNDQYSLNLFED